MRLTNNIRSEILSKLVNKVMEPRVKEEHDLNVELSKQVYELRMIPEYVEYVKKSPVGASAFTSENHFRVYVGEESVNVSNYDNSFPIFYYMDREYTWAKVEKDTQLGKDLLKLKELGNVNHSYRSELQMRTQQILKQCTTTKKLAEIWPDLVDILPEIFVENGSTANLPMIPIKEVNELISKLNPKV